MTQGTRDWFAVGVGALRMSSGVSFLVAPKAASAIWGSDPEDNPTANLLLRSMGYRDALVGGMLLRAGLRGDGTAGWYLASGGADLADLIGGIANHDRLPRRTQTVGNVGAAVGVAVGLGGALLARRRRS
jgi:Domain of unknown function (DUF4267)